MNVNYIKHLEAVTLHMAEDSRLNTSHVSMYLALFLLWNHNRFQNPISINRSEVMKISKIGAGATYHKCITDLHVWRYLQYEPSHNPLKGSLVHLFNFDTSVEQVPEQVQAQVMTEVFEQVENQVQDASLNSNKQKKHTNNKNFNIPKLEEIKDFFKNDEEACKFFNYYESNGWQIGRNKMKNWQAAANNWQINAKKFMEKKTAAPRANQLHINQDKDYSIPL